MMGMSLYVAGGGSDHPPFCLRISSVFGFAPFCAPEPDGAAGLGAGLRVTMGFAGFFRIGRRGLAFLFLEEPFGRAGALAGGFPGGGGALMLATIA